MAGGLPTTAARLVTEWTALRRDEFMANRERAQVPDALMPVEGLR
jgi:hypothetical protein